MSTAADTIVKDQVVVRVPREVKKRAEAACKAMGLPMSSAITGFLRYVGDERRIPFEFAAPAESREAYFSSLRQDSTDYRAGILDTVSLEEMKALYGLED
ncbi:addiction module RelB/DinJ family antitoxin [Mobiluncus mulieris]|uniref:Addiction module antitoxin, RelB/DinJ family n=1 Tax=Mobiluncus mulieris TaxID=2052 RepID=A0A8G2M5W1_9ACTO|nr:type II toxin-antitoxin system RelB/DinJ family antitoxin [Mobiluncus mulieris]EFN93914.1 addiction module antitoxin, RelB/DinJ family [Mobiluncus mulieris FB024-16]MBB5845562.1 addiction module RelB/DinJ family antitoxin [Mobiluncus mulieris]MCU9971360.1 type II toxin-antitoxin system RelB/DinJ family antitoxin [Mobiluncus mulieris]MCV0002707.1 type II toxin-antitoxin system RelB/DinJ family antitoxin [Mobiluncus mulieris]MCV0011917.1 type II toxin-antitoxin system RelB/DinJ family antitox